MKVDKVELTTGEIFTIGKEIVGSVGTGNPNHATLRGDIARAYFAALHSPTLRRLIAEAGVPGTNPGSGGAQSGDGQGVNVLESTMTRAGLEPATYGLKGPGPIAGDTPSDTSTAASTSATDDVERRSAPENEITSPERSPEEAATAGKVIDLIGALRKAIPCLLFALALASCSIISDLTGPATGAYPPGTVQFSPLDSFPQYATWWAKIQQCSGTTRPFSDLNFFVVKNAFDFEHDGQSVYGYFVVPMNIVLADASLNMEAEVEHEMLHAALYQQFGLKYYNAADAHPAEYFKVKCPFVAQNPEGQ